MVVCGTKNKQSLCEPSCNGNIPVASPLPTNIKPSRYCKMRLHTAEMRPDDMFLNKNHRGQD